MECVYWIEWQYLCVIFATRWNRIERKKGIKANESNWIMVTTISVLSIDVEKKSLLHTSYWKRRYIEVHIFRVLFPVDFTSDVINELERNVHKRTREHKYTKLHKHKWNRHRNECDKVIFAAWNWTKLKK